MYRSDQSSCQIGSPLSFKRENNMAQSFGIFSSSNIIDSGNKAKNPMIANKNNSLTC